MVSGHAYAKGLRTVKTCVGTEWCRFGTQDSTGLGIKLEKMSVRLVDAGQGQARGLGLPAQLRRGDDQGHRHRLRRVGLRHPHRRRCRPARAGTDLLGHVESEEEAIECVAAVMQLYREQAVYLDRVWKWSEKYGLEKIRAAVMDDGDNRRALVQRFKKSQRAVQRDPWAERAAGRELREFRPLAVLASAGKVARKVAAE